MIATLVAWLWLASLGPFQDGLHCTVRGYVSFETKQVALSRDDGCQLRVFVLGKQMVIVSEQKWVLIEFPDETPGFESFWYAWGAAHAYVHGTPLPIAWGYTLRG